MSPVLYRTHFFWVFFLSLKDLCSFVIYKLITKMLKVF